MRVEIIRSLALRPEIDDGPRSAVLPVIDSWYAYWRTLTPIYLFRGQTTEEDIFPKLRTSLCRALNDLPHLLATLQPCTILSNDQSKSPIQRVKAIWGTETTSGEFIEARTSARVRSLLPVSVPPNRSYLWNRSDKSLRALFPQSTPASSALRVQVTVFRCGGFGIALDLDHALADAHTVALLMQRWCVSYTQLYAPELNTSTLLPSIVSRADIVPIDVNQPSMLLEKASKLPIRRPDRRTLNPKAASGKLKPSPQAQILKRSYGGTPHLLHLTDRDYVRISQRIRGTGDLQITEKVALMTVLWTALNRARTRASLEPIELEVTKDYRYTLGLPEGLTGCPCVAVMMDMDDDTLHGRNDGRVLAGRMAATLDACDEDAIRAVAYDASLRDSPTSSARSGSSPQERMYFTLGMQSRTVASLKFGPYSPILCAPLTMPIDNLIMMADSFAKGKDGKWHRSGIDFYFCLTQVVLTELLCDPDLACVEQLSDF